MKWLKYLIAVLIPVIVVLMINQWMDNDSWDVLAEGRYIVENGVYHEDVLSMHEGLHTVVQNYGFAAVFYMIYSVFGAHGIYITMLILNFVILFLLYKICMLLSNKNVKLSLILMAVTDSILAFGFITTRAQMVDYIVFLGLIYVMELFIKTDKTKYLWWIPALSLLLANVHASVWWIIFAIMAVYIIDGFKRPKRFLQGYRLKPLLLAFVVSALVGVINPYGLEMLTSIFTAYKGMADLSFVSELQPFSPLMSYNIIRYLAILVVLTLYIFAKRKIRIRYLLLFFGFLTMGLSSVKGMSELLLTMFLPLAFLYRDWKVPRLFDSPKIGKGVTVCVAIAISCVALIMAVMALSEVDNKPTNAMAEAMDIIDADVGDKDKKELKVYVGYNQGGYVEYRGYPAYLDPRGADFMKSVNGKEDILAEWLDIKNGKIKTEDFLGKYGFDYLVIEEYYEEGLKNLEDKRYELIYSNDENETRVYKKVEVI